MIVQNCSCPSIDSMRTLTLTHSSMKLHGNQEIASLNDKREIGQLFSYKSQAFPNAFVTKCIQVSHLLSFTYLCLISIISMCEYG